VPTRAPGRGSEPEPSPTSPVTASTWATNAIGTDNLVLQIAGIVVAAGFAAWGWRHRDGLAVTLLVSFAPAAPWLMMQVMLTR
jgi:hypothetical protein